MHLRKGELDQALEYCEKSLAINEKLRNKQKIALSLNCKGNVFYVKGEMRQALEYFEKSLVIREKLGNMQEIAHSLINIGVIYHETGELVQALEYYHKSLVIDEKLCNDRLIQLKSFNILQVDFHLGIRDVFSHLNHVRIARHCPGQRETQKKHSKQDRYEG